ncbi:hypothetical protein BT63DRAFT_106499 [Microthyrium microscopicum]|uniref:Uncharacterized protein n=1 Tax=Microthyrium microscopicum TaxID=703497 RepID=A0A6A6TZP6_9PEZI|nr:hypothetical protein BT63DRAFT_106499 [Microthyrium microscopicum]
MMNSIGRATTTRLGRKVGLTTTARRPAATSTYESNHSAHDGAEQNNTKSPELAANSTNPKKTVAELDEELRLKLEERSGDGGMAGIELEDGKPNAMKRSVRENMYRVILLLGTVSTSVSDLNCGIRTMNAHFPGIVTIMHDCYATAAEGLVSSALTARQNKRGKSCCWFEIRETKVGSACHCLAAWVKCMHKAISATFYSGVDSRSEICLTIR